MTNFTQKKKRKCSFKKWIWHDQNGNVYPIRIVHHLCTNVAIYFAITWCKVLKLVLNSKIIDNQNLPNSEELEHLKQQKTCSYNKYIDIVLGVNQQWELNGTYNWNFVLSYTVQSFSEGIMLKLDNMCANVTVISAKLQARLLMFLSL